MIHPIHTPISAITHFDRSTKVVFECMLHPESQWMSKQPSCSTWFSASDSTVECDCGIGDPVWWTSFEYNDGDLVEAHDCGYFHTKANGCPTPDMIARNHEGYNGTYEGQDF